MMTRDREHDILTLSEIAKYLKVSEKTILRLVQAGDLPGAKISNQWRFMRDIIDDWLTDKMQSASKSDLLSVINTGKKITPLSKLISKERIIMDIEPGSKRFILEQLVKPLFKFNFINDPELFIEDLMRREDVVSTAVARHVATPHAQDSKAICDGPALVVGICQDNTDFGSLDGGPTHVFLLSCTTTHSMHLRIMARIALMLRSPYVIKKITTAERKSEILDIIVRTDTELVMSL